MRVPSQKLPPKAATLDLLRVRNIVVRTAEALLAVYTAADVEDDELLQRLLELIAEAKS